MDVDEADILEQADLVAITDDGHVDVDHEQVVQELDSFAGTHSDVERIDYSGEQQHGAVLPVMFAGVAIIQFLLACFILASLIYFIICDFIELQHRRRMNAGDMAGQPGEDQGGDNNANDDDDDDDERVQVPPAAPEGTPPSQFPNNIAAAGLRHRGPAAAGAPPRPPPPPPPPPVSSRPVAVVQVSAPPLTLTVVDGGVAGALQAAASTAESTDGRTLGDDSDLTSRPQGSGAGGAKPNKTRHSRKYQSMYRSQTSEDSAEDGRSSPTSVDDSDVAMETSSAAAEAAAEAEAMTSEPTTSRDSGQQVPADVISATLRQEVIASDTKTSSESAELLPADVISAKEAPYSGVDAQPSTTPGVELTEPAARSLSADGGGSGPSATGASDRANVDDVDTPTVAAQRTDPSPWRRLGVDELLTTSVWPADLLTHTTMTTTVPPGPATTSSPLTELFHRRPELPWENWDMEMTCKDGVCGLQAMTSHRQYSDSQAFPPSQDRPTDFAPVKDAKSDSIASSAAGAPMKSERLTATLDNAMTVARDVRPVGATQPLDWDEILVGGLGSPRGPGHGATSQPDLPLHDSRDPLTHPAAVTDAETGTQVEDRRWALPPPATAGPNDDDAGLVAAAATVVRQSTAAARPLLLASHTKVRPAAAEAEENSDPL